MQRSTISVGFALFWCCTVHDDSSNLNEEIIRSCYFLMGHFVGEKGTSYMYHSIFIVLLQHISPLTQLWTQTFIVAYETPIFKSVQSNSCFRNSCWSGVKSAQALKKGASNWPIRVQYFWPEFINFQSKLVQTSIFFWLVCLQTSRSVVQINWINTKFETCCLHGT